MPRPPETTTPAVVSSGRPEVLRVWPSKRASAGASGTSTGSTAALPPVAAAGSNAVPRTVSILIGSVACTVAIALPA